MMRFRAPPPRLVAKSAALVLLAVVPVGLAWWLLEGETALAVYLGMTFMTMAVGRLSLSGQCLVGLSAGLAAAVGSWVAGSTPLLIAAVVAACAAQFYVNRLSVGAAALLPSNIVLYATLAPDAPGRVAIANWLGAAVVIVLAGLVRMRLTAEPAATREAIVHAVELAAGCTALIVVTRALDLPRGNWAVLTLCLVLVPGARRTGRRVMHRALGTATGALLAVAVAVVAPPKVCLLLAAVCAVLTVAYAVLPDDFLYAVFLTPTVLLLFSSGRANATVPIALERVGMTALGAALALALSRGFARL